MSAIHHEEEYSRVNSTLHLLREVAQAEDSRVDSILHLLREVLQAEDSRIQSNSHLQRQDVQSSDISSNMTDMYQEEDSRAVDSKVDSIIHLLREVVQEEVSRIRCNSDLHPQRRAVQVANPENPYELWLKEMRGWLLLVSSLIAACAYTASVSPPGGFWQDDILGHSAGEPIFKDKSHNRFILFRFFNSVALALSFVIMVIIMRKSTYTKSGKELVRALQILTVGSIAAISVAHSAITISYDRFRVDVPYLVIIFLILTDFITWFHSPFSKLDIWIKTTFEGSVTKIRQMRLVWDLIHIIVRVGIIAGLVTLSVKESRSTGYWGNPGYNGGLVSLVLLGLVLWWFGK